jgi:hypothetical protein
MLPLWQSRTQFPFLQGGTGFGTGRLGGCEVEDDYKNGKGDNEEDAKGNDEEDEEDNNDGKDNNEEDEEDNDGKDNNEEDEEDDDGEEKEEEGVIFLSESRTTQAAVILPHLQCLLLPARRNDPKPNKRRPR